MSALLKGGRGESGAGEGSNGVISQLPRRFPRLPLELFSAVAIITVLPERILPGKLTAGFGCKMLSGRPVINSSITAGFSSHAVETKDAAHGMKRRPASCPRVVPPLFSLLRLFGSLAGKMGH